MTFNQAAATYDQDFTHSPIAQWLRERVWARLDELFLPGMRVLELGCGTGEDARHLVQRGVQVVGTDASPAMLQMAQAKTPSLETQLLDFNDRSTWQLEGQFDGVYSNFGALNCTRDWSALSAYLAEHMQPRTVLGVGIMGRFCLWETLWHGLHMDFRTASRRWRGQGQAVLADGSRLPVYYPSPREFSQHLDAHFEMNHYFALGVFLPSSDIYPVVEQRPRFQKWLTRLEYHLAHRPPWRGWGDHYWMEGTRR